MTERKMTMGVIVGNRNFFPALLAKSGREEIIETLARKGYDIVVLTPDDTRYGVVESFEDAKRCAALFRENRDRIDGVIVTLPNFGDERAVANTLRLADLRVPVLVQASPDTAGKMTIQYRRDSFCGKMSVCNNLRQYGIAYSLTKLHTESLDSLEFDEDLAKFAATCRVVKGLKNLRIGCIGARPAAFNTVRFSEKFFEANGISVEPIDLSDIISRIEKLANDDKGVRRKLDEILTYAPTKGVPEPALVKMAKLGFVIEDWMRETEVGVCAVQCWTSMEEYFGVTPCAVMSMMSNNLVSSACEVDVCGAIAMHALTLASQRPSALLDWNNNYGDDPNKAVCFHCSNLPKDFFETVKMDYHEILAGTIGKNNAYGVVVGRVKPGAMSYARFSTDDLSGRIRGYVGSGAFTDDPLQTFGGIGVVAIPDLQRLLRYICENGFEHHVAANLSNSAAAVHEAAARYMGWDMYWHGVAA